MFLKNGSIKSIKREIIRKLASYKRINNVRAISILLIYENDCNYLVYINENEACNENIIDINNTLYVY